ncbi:Erg28 like protein-domain-containing protein [Lentinula raphanica]|uniref:Erg28 like protein-domain-containing protein n=1 Tax=Lentinula raphanica TaxID=153919 RepID=A0AA38P7G5_9AGAR|nr:Erg28 like protein-domain-containing protein [Lentinula raphanica]
MDVLKSCKLFLILFLPVSEGWLPIWQLIVASAATFNAIQNYTTLKLTQRLYARTPHLVNPLQARTFGTWTITSAVIRAYAAYHIHEKTIYDICIISYLIAFSHFTSELLIFKTSKLNGPVLSPVIVSSVSLVWMILQYDFYLTKA